MTKNSASASADRGLGLFLHARGQRALGAFVEACGVDQREFEIAELALALAAVAGDRRAYHRPAPASARPSRLNSVDLPTLGRPMMAIVKGA